MGGAGKVLTIENDSKKIFRLNDFLGEDVKFFYEMRHPYFGKNTVDETKNASNWNINSSLYGRARFAFGSYISYTNIGISLNKGFFISLWVNPLTYKDYFLFDIRKDAGYGYGVYMHTDVGLGIIKTGLASGYSSEFSIEARRILSQGWKNLSVSYSNSVFTLYIDGEVVGKRNNVYSNLHKDISIGIGSRFTLDNMYFDGAISDFYLSTKTDWTSELAKEYYKRSKKRNGF